MQRSPSCYFLSERFRFSILCVDSRNCTPFSGMPASNVGPPSDWGEFRRNTAFNLDRKSIRFLVLVITRTLPQQACIMLHFLPDLFSRSVGNNTTVATVFLNMLLHGAEVGGGDWLQFYTN
jgi:hypothetical protein